MHEDLFTIVKAREAEYRTRADAYDEELRLGHKPETASHETLAHLRRTNAIAAGVMTALELYQAAVADLAARLGRKR